MQGTRLVSVASLNLGDSSPSVRKPSLARFVQLHYGKGLCAYTLTITLITSHISWYSVCTKHGQGKHLVQFVTGYRETDDAPLEKCLRSDVSERTVLWHVAWAWPPRPLQRLADINSLAGTSLQLLSGQKNFIEGNLHMKMKSRATINPRDLCS